MQLFDESIWLDGEVLKRSDKNMVLAQLACIQGLS
jgi:hypothetical protein